MTTSTPSYTQAESYLETRAYNEGITVDELLDMTPTSVSDDPVESMMFWQQRDYSHKFPTSLYPHLEDDPENGMPENPSDNRSRGAEIMTDQEQSAAELDNELLASSIDTMYTVDDYLPVDVIPDYIPIFGLV